MHHRTARLDDLAAISGGVAAGIALQDAGDEQLETVPGDVVSERGVGYFEMLPERLTAVSFVLRATVATLLTLRFLLLASGANRSSDFAKFVENTSWLFAWPFANVFGSYVVGSRVLEVSTLVAIAVYFVLFILLGKLIGALTPRLQAPQASTGEVTPSPSSVDPVLRWRSPKAGVRPYQRRRHHFSRRESADSSDPSLRLPF